MKHMKLDSSASSTLGWKAGNEFLAEKLRIARMDSGDSVDDVALEVGVSASEYVSWEKSEMRPAAEQLAKIAKYHGLHTKELLALQPANSQKPYPVGRSFLGDIYEDTVEESFRKRLVWMMLSYNYTPDSLAHRIGVDAGAVDSWCTGASTPTLQYLVIIASVFDVGVSELVA